MFNTLFRFNILFQRRYLLASFISEAVSGAAIGVLSVLLVACSPGDVVVDTPIPELATMPVAPSSEPIQTEPIQAASSSTPIATWVYTPTLDPLIFDGENSYDFLLAQMAFGPRWPGSPGHQAAGDYIIRELEGMDWDVEQQRLNVLGIEGRNIIGRANIGAGPVIIIGAHYDTRKLANMTPDSQEPVPGAVDGASGVAVLLELARVLDRDRIDREIWLTFFDMEDNGSGGMPGFEYIIGSSFMAQQLTIMPEAMVLVDMVGDADQQLYYEGNSDPDLRETIWRIAAELGYGENFIPEQRHTMIDDHLPFARIGIPSVDIIDFDYPYWHTVEDTADKASPGSLMRVGRTLETWLEGWPDN